MQEHKSIQEMWVNYINFIGEDIIGTDKKYTSWHFCDNEKGANDLSELVKNGIKRATTGLYYFYEIEGETLPKAGDLSIITDWQSIAQCVIETQKVNLMPFNEVTEEFAKIEGEGDKSLKFWREVHISAFNRQLEEIKVEFSDEMLVVCEEFEMVYK
ncbi:ASCH domain-containing protein [Desulfitobacterium metallireducens]|uniref:RNA-binding protein n=1 Tax=Desulfitobacterium metallireducens DSM 15288 TaxID=871968 RepID=W0E5M9_9FIRM|nr:ASCH domain-containing protein [Desulfitobacterium metallireducens]AHF06155.1 RNA-binding protein [Desulfitobacterium metallireducens DSM 15288]